MKIWIVALTSLSLFGCASKGPQHTAEVVPSCFSDGENQERVCKAQRTNENGKSVVTRCIGTKNNEALPALRGKCVEKICSDDTNTECITRGEFAVLQQYAELMTSGLFASDDEASSKRPAGKTGKGLQNKSLKQAATKSLKPAKEVSVDPSVALPPLPQATEKVVVLPAASKPPVAAAAPAEEPASMSITLKPAKAVKSRSSRAPASVAGASGFKKVCVPKGKTSAPEILRGKCATRHCKDGKCTYNGRKEMFEWVFRNGG